MVNPANAPGGPNRVGYSVTSNFGGGAGAGPYLVPGGATSGQQLDIYVVGPIAAGAGAGQVTLPSVTLPAPLPSTQTVFSAQVASPGGGNSLSVLQITAQPIVWSALPADRASLLAAFRVLQAQLEALESASSSPIVKGSTELIVNRVAAALPLRYDEILPFFYDFDPAGQTIDIAAGMALQVAWAGYQYCDGPGGPNEGYNGFATTGLTVLDVVRRPDLTLAFDSFSGLFLPGIQLQPPAPSATPVLAGGPVDLQLGGNARRHFKLLWPATFPASNSTEAPGTISLSCQLIGADTYADLAASLAQIQAGQNGCITQADGKPVVVIEFTGRVTIVPHIRTWANGMPQTVAVGTTVRNAVQRFAAPAPYQLANTGIGPTPFSLGLSRWMQRNEPPAPPGPHDETYMLAAVDFTGADQAVGPCGDGFDLPLLQGDGVTLGGGNGSGMAQVGSTARGSAR
ncbi:MAG TPA: hypothetical protein VFP12_04205 [Allosphingosinicella sp.]|nr:hypothetical protein [Allosphingosinicella sp.]